MLCWIQWTRGRGAAAQRQHSRSHLSVTPKDECELHASRRGEIDIGDQDVLTVHGCVRIAPAAGTPFRAATPPGRPCAPGWLAAGRLPARPCAPSPAGDLTGSAPGSSTCTAHKGHEDCRQAAHACGASSRGKQGTHTPSPRIAHRERHPASKCKPRWSRAELLAGQLLSA